MPKRAKTRSALSPVWKFGVRVENRRESELGAHDVIAAVDVEGFAGDGAGEVAGEKRAGRPSLALRPEKPHVTSEGLAP
jgi:hypothetical protein